MRERDLAYRQSVNWSQPIIPFAFCSSGRCLSYGTCLLTPSRIGKIGFCGLVSLTIQRGEQFCVRTVSADEQDAFLSATRLVSF